MRVVIDTNVLVSGLLSPRSVSGEIVRLLSQGALVLCHDARILDEYREVLARPTLGFEPSKVETLLMLFEKDGETCVGRRLEVHLPDRDDEPFLEVALGAGVRYLVTGNLKDYPAALKSVEIIPPKRFVDEWQSSKPMS